LLDVFWHDDVLLHDTGSGVFEAAPSPILAEPELHPENAVRLLNMKAILERGPLSQHVRWHEGRHADTAELAAVSRPGLRRVHRRSLRRWGREADLDDRRLGRLLAGGPRRGRDRARRGRGRPLG
jgi:hypothetical protein